MSTKSADLLSEDDRCSLLAFHSQRWRPPALAPKQILRESIEHGLTCDKEDFALAASDFAMDLAATRGIDSPEADLLAVANHIQKLAELITFALRIDQKWVRPEPREFWEPSSFLSHTGNYLRQFVLVDRLDALREMEIRNRWDVQGEAAIYGVPVSVMIVVIGQHRNGKWSSPWTTAYQHPINKGIRFRKRDGEPLGPGWEKVWRDKEDRGLWYDSLCDDGILEECIHVIEVPVPDPRIVDLARRKMERIRNGSKPDPQLSNCYSHIHPCPFRAACPRGLEPCEELGFDSKP